MHIAGMKIKNIKYEALQYHLYHDADPSPHNENTVSQFCNPSSWWTEYGIKKGVREHTPPGTPPQNHFPREAL
jgi:hypothetical protein